MVKMLKCINPLKFVRFQASAMMYMRSSLSQEDTQCRLVVTDSSGKPLSPIFKGPAVRWRRDEWLSRNVSNLQPIYAVLHPRIAKFSSNLFNLPGKS
jgi:hypothetical protein